MKEGTIITCQQSQVLLKVNSTEEDLAQVEVTDSGKGEIFQYDRISFDDLDNDDEEITERDKKDILWGIRIWSACNRDYHVQIPQSMWKA